MDQKRPLGYTLVAFFDSVLYQELQMFIRTVQKEVLTMAKIGYARVSSKEQHLDR